MMAFLKRLAAYGLQRLGEPTTWAGIFLIGAGLFGWHPSPEKQAAITTLGLYIFGSLLIVAREGRNKPDNPSLPATIKGECPPQKPDIVTPPANPSP
jgi:hypothetical protein